MITELDLQTVEEAVMRLRRMADGLEVMGTLAAIADLSEILPDIAADAVAAGVQAGLTQKAMAQALGVPASALRGAKREFAR